jgi:hypothetical protein
MLKGFGIFRQADSNRGIHILVHAIHALTLSSRVADFATQRVEDAEMPGGMCCRHLGAIS